MNLTKQTVIIVIIFIVIVLLVVFAYRIDGFCNCTGFGVQVDKPTNTFWRGAWPRNKSAMDLNSPSPYGAYPTGCNSPGLGWPQMSERPFNRSHYDYATISDPYGVGSNEIRDLNRDAVDGLLDNSKIQAAYGQQVFEIPYDMSAVPRSSKCCDCGPTKQVGASNGSGGCGGVQQYSGRFLPLAAIPCSSLPPGAVTSADPNMNAYENQIRFGAGKYDNLAVGVL